MLPIAVAREQSGSGDPFERIVDQRGAIRMPPDPWESRLFQTTPLEEAGIANSCPASIRKRPAMVPSRRRSSRVFAEPAGFEKWKVPVDAQALGTENEVILPG